MARNHVGRHRAPGYNPLNEIADIATRSAQPAMKVSAVAVASGGLVATFAMPASAAPSQDEAPAVAAGAQAVATAPQIASQTVAVAAPALAEAATVQASVGVLGFTAQAAPAANTAPLSIAKIAPPPPPPAPAAAPAPAATPAAATTTRAARTTTPARTAPAPAAPAPAPAPAAPVAAPSGGILAIAASLAGIPYVYGGMSRSGADCSGYVSLVYQAMGKSIPRTAEAQRQAATKVSNPQPGDLIFFGFPAYHVGIYAGGGKLWDAEKPGTTSGLHVIWTQTNLSYGRL